MNLASRPALAVAAALCAGGCGQPHGVEAGFWFEPVTFQSKVIDGAMTAADLATIEAVARAELTQAFRRLRGNWGVAGESFSVPGLGGNSSVSFYFLASGAVG